jgi:hypothetical protein
MGWKKVEAPDEVRRALVEFAEPVVAPITASSDAKAIEQLYCFAAAVWNAVVPLDALGNPHLMTELLGRMNGLGDGPFEECLGVLDELCGLKETHYRDCLWVYRHVHVVRKGAELNVRAEALTLGDWLESREPLRIGLPA